MPNKQGGINEGELHDFFTFCYYFFYFLFTTSLSGEQKNEDFEEEAPQDGL